MDWLTFISSLVKDGAWPLAIGVVTYLVTTRSKEVARHIDGVTLPKGFAIKFRNGTSDQQSDTTPGEPAAQRPRRAAK